LDGKTKLEIIKLLGKLNVEQGTTIVIVTHDSQAASMGENVIRLRRKTVGERKQGTHMNM
jgi:ABC-type lipoprotein export system ATPase subunit